MMAKWPGGSTRGQVAAVRAPVCLLSWARTLCWEFTDQTQILKWACWLYTGLLWKLSTQSSDHLRYFQNSRDCLERHKVNSAHLTTHTRTHTHKHIYAHTYPHTHMHTHIPSPHTHTHAHTQTHTHTHPPHTHTQTCTLGSQAHTQHAHPEGSSGLALGSFSIFLLNPLSHEEDLLVLN